MKQSNWMAIIAILFVLSQNSFVRGQGTDIKSAADNSGNFATDWIDAALTTLINNANAGNGSSTADSDVSSDPTASQKGPVWSTSQGMYFVVLPDGTSESGSYLTDENGFTTTEVHKNN